MTGGTSIKMSLAQTPRSTGSSIAPMRVATTCEGRAMGRSKRVAGVLGLVALGLLVGSVLIRQDSTAQVPKEGAGELGDSPFGWMFSDPLGGGAESVQRAEAEAFLSSRSVNWPALPAESVVASAWIRYADGYVAFEMADGLTIYLQPDARSEAVFVRDAGQMGEAEGSAWPFRLESIRGVQAQVADTHKGVVTEDGVQVGPGPAAISWVEGGYLVSLIGGPPATSTGLPLSELRAFAQAMG